ncbi:MAG: hypothetical protein Q9220_002213 [cf. Caloplaca sp. 1 TL-2023]
MAYTKAARGDIFTSDIFSVYAGPTCKQFLVHADILSASPVLDKMISGVWNERTKRCINLREWEEQTVAQVVEWLYRGDYAWNFAVDDLKDDTQATAVDSTAAPSPAGKAPVVEQSNQSSNLAAQVQRHRPGTFTRTLETIAQIHPVDGIKKTLLPSSRDAINLLPNAKVYVLANYLQLVELKRSALNNIQGVICNIELERSDPSTVATIAELAGFVYGNTDALVNEVEPLRNLFLSFLSHRLRNTNDNTMLHQLRMANPTKWLGEYSNDIWRRNQRRRIQRTLAHGFKKTQDDNESFERHYDLPKENIELS